jgi:hypothetical protein
MRVNADAVESGPYGAAPGRETRPDRSIGNPTDRISALGARAKIPVVSETTAAWRPKARCQSETFSPWHEAFHLGVLRHGVGTPGARWKASYLSPSFPRARASAADVEGPRSSL